MQWSMASVFHQIPKIALTVKIIKVTRFRTFKTPCVKTDAIQNGHICARVFFSKQQTLKVEVYSSY